MLIVLKSFLENLAFPWKGCKSNSNVFKSMLKLETFTETTASVSSVVATRPRFLESSDR